jgi:hypothetical protein
MTYPASASFRSIGDVSRPDGKLRPRCRNTPPHSPPATMANVWTSGESAAWSVNRNHAKPSSTMRAPVRLSGHRRAAYSPVPMKLQPTSGAKSAHTTLAS